MKWYNIPPRHFVKWVFIPPGLLLFFLVVNRMIGVYPAELFSGAGWIFAGAALAAWELFFVFSWRICEADADGIRVRRLLGRSRGGTWGEFVYVGLVSKARTPDKASDETSEWTFVCARKMPYQRHPAEEGYTLCKGTIVLPRSEETQRALKTYCPDYSETLYVGIRETQP